MDNVVGSASAGTASEILCASKYSPGYSQWLNSYAVSFPSYRGGSCIEQRRVVGSVAFGLRQRKNIHNKRRRKFKGIMRLWAEVNRLKILLAYILDRGSSIRLIRS